MSGAGFLDLPARSVKPRSTGITHVLDRGIPLGQMADLLDLHAPYLDVWKFGWGISYLDSRLAAKLELLAGHRVLASPGGTLLEIAWAQGRAPEFLAWARDCGFPCVEVSAGTVPMDDGAKRDLIAAAAEQFIVLAEVGSKDSQVTQPPQRWAQAAAGDLDAGATWVLAEGRASGTAGLYRASGAVRQDVVAALQAVPCPDCIVFEAPREDQQAWFINRLGPEVNLANVHPAGALALESLRLSLRADTYRARPADHVPARAT
ncbi:MAG TPA: phosphosulfolactate synthase [Streptosporangiaceae bacterium]|jgi:phosphosulfolactate synthase|nr:phosphosulfolactate synthase [Streptosporangiaceae bacterium]